MAWLLPPLEPNFEAALRDVGARGIEARVAAAHRLGRPEGGREREAERALLTLLRDPAPPVRAAALRSLAEAGTAAAHGPVRAHLDDPDPLVRELAAVALCDIDHPERAEALLAALAHPGPEVRFQALIGAAQHCPEQATDATLALSRDPDPRVREAAVRALASLGTGDGRILARLRALLDDPVPGVRFEAALAVSGTVPGSGTREPAATALLVAALAEPDRRLDALEALGHHPDPAAAEAVHALGRRVLVPPVVNAMAGQCLLRMGERERAVPCLRDALRALRGDGRNLALTAIEEHRLPELGPELLALCGRPRGSDPELLARATAAVADDSAEAARGLTRLAARSDAAGALARALAAGRDA